ncbi:MAG: GAF domain-containing protein [Chloroflexota bacterium]
MCRVLILDDDIHVANSIKSILESESRFTPEVCLRLEDALQKAQAAGQRGKPFEILLIDMRLRDEKDGIQAMLELQKLNPEAEAIIFTGFEDPEDGILAYKAGALRYMTKPIQREELLFVVNALVQKRQQEVEQRWQKIFIEMTESALHEKDFSRVARIVLKHSIKLGFARAHLFWVPRREDASPQRDSLLGIGCKGQGCLSKFSGQMFRMADLGSLAAHLKSHDVSLVQPSETDGIFRLFGELTPPIAAWVVLPLWSRDELLGCLTLDYGTLERGPRPFELDLLNFFARQVSVVLENSSLHGSAERTLKETEIIGEIGRQVSASAATQDLSQLLERIRKQLGDLLDVSNFSIFLYNEEKNELNFALHYENNIPKKVRPRQPGNGLEEYMLRQGREIYIPGDLSGFIREHRLDLGGPAPICWLGAPLRVSEKTIGGIVIKRYVGKKFPERDKNILAAAADQVAGAIQISKYAAEEAEDARRVQLLNRASVEMLRIAQKDENEFWLTVLTLATAEFGLGFNRALLFLIRDNHRILKGQAGIGTEEREEAVRDWKRDRKRNYDFDAFLKTLGTKRMRLTPFHTKAGEVEIPLDNGNDAINSVFDGQVKTVGEGELAEAIPRQILEAFSLSACAVMPLRAGNKALGMVIVDNKHNRQPLTDKSLSRLQTLLDNAGLVWEIIRQGKKSEDLLDATYKITAGASYQVLRDTITRICQAARRTSEADWAIIYPITGRTPHQLELDLDNFGYDGRLNSPVETLIATQPRVGGISMRVIKRGTLVVQDVDKDDKSIGKLRLSEHHFVKEEGVKALIGVAVRDPFNNESLGILYLDYRKPREFNETAIHHAKSFASLAAIAIANTRRLDENRQRARLMTALETSETVGADLDLENILSNVLSQLQNIFPHTTLCVLLYDRDDNALKFAPATLKYYSIRNPEYKNRQSFSLDRIEKGSIACKVARKALSSKTVERHHAPDVGQDPEYLALNPGTRSELCVSLMKTNGDLLGILALERSQSAFESDDIALVETVARQLSLSIERAQEKERLVFLSTIAAMTAWAADLAHDVNNEVGQIRNLAYLVNAVASGNPKIQEYTRLIDKSARVLSGVGPWSDRTRHAVPLDPALTTFVTELVGDRGISLELSLNAPGISIRANPQELKRVLRHLVRNAARAMKDSDTKKILVTTRPVEGSQVEILFRDFGPGVDDKVRARIFQVQASTKEQGGGYGLIITRHLIETMDGSIKLAASNPGEGATFSITLPVMDAIRVSETD